MSLYLGNVTIEAPSGKDEVLPALVYEGLEGVDRGGDYGAERGLR